MSESAFDPYYSWLGIPRAEQPADYYRLLGVSRFENNAEVISNAAERQIRHVRTFQLGENARHSQTLLNELATARACLLNSASKAAYDQQLHAQMAEQNPPPVASSHPATTSPARRSGRRRPRSPFVEVAKILVGGIAGLVIGMAILWYGFGMDVLGVMRPPRDVTANPLKQSNAKAPPKAESQAVKSLDESTGAKPIVPKPKSKTEVVQPRTTNHAQPSAHWQILAPTTLEALHGTKLSVSEDSSVLASGFSAQTNTYVLTATSPLTEITGFQLEALPDSSLPANGPGRCSGNFVVTEFKVFKIGSDGEALPIALRNGSASYEQDDGRGNVFSAARAIDGDEHGTYHGWSLVPGLGKPHRMVVETVEPISGSEMILRIVLDQQYGAQATLGRFRLAVTSSPPPFYAGEDVKSPPEAPLNDSGSPQAQADLHEKSASAEATSKDVNLAPVRLTVPSPDSLAAAEEIVRSVFADEYVSSKTPAEKSELAAKLLQIGLDTTDDLASRFVTIRSARNVAVEAGSVDLAFRAIDALTDSFEMDNLAERARSAEDLAKVSLNDEEMTKLKHRIVEFREEAFDRDVYPVALSLNNLARDLGKVTDKQWRATTDRWTKRIEAGSAAFEIVQEALKTLESSPEDAAANLTIGRYRCLLKSEWQIGLPYLAKGDDEKLRAIAEREMASSDPTPNETLALADSWWDLAAELDGIEQPQSQMRAAQLYESALPNLSGLSAAKADKRVRELRALGIDSNAVPPQLPHRRPAPTDGASKSEFKVIVNSIGMKLVLVPAGEFMMGSGKSAGHLAAAFATEAEHFMNEFPRHRVVITKPFYMGIYEVTRGEFAEFVADQKYETESERDGEGGYGWIEETGKFVGPDPKYSWRTTGFPQSDRHPVVNVTWNDAVAFCAWLSKKEHRICRLPTEAEWEYTCRGGTTSLYQHGDNQEDLAKVGNVGDSSARAKWVNYPGLEYISANDGHVFSAAVGHYRPNPFGLFDMHGNVWEWCEDVYADDYYANSPTEDPPGPTNVGSSRVLRGGSWLHSARFCRCAKRSRNHQSSRHYFYGFRVVRAID